IEEVSLILTLSSCDCPAVLTSFSGVPKRYSSSDWRGLATLRDVSRLSLVAHMQLRSSCLLSHIPIHLHASEAAGRLHVVNSPLLVQCCHTTMRDVSLHWMSGE
ncbi:hypothetical protein OESDEN_18021, partial [Oesophagostomum dentatum]